MTMKAEYTNRLAEETSPYLLQHAHNPVDWYPWGGEAFEAARKADKPIFLSVGYSACHWCHVMEHESFEDPGTARIMNELFINVKVDREERPDVDQIYMNAVQLMTMRGGWPISVWLTPDLKPFYGGTYFPPQRKYGMPSFHDVLHGVADAWKNRRGELLKAADDMTSSIQKMGLVEHRAGELSHDLILAAAQELASMIDREWGGIGQAPKFPHSVEMRLLLRASALTGNQAFADLALMSLQCMADGGMYDHLGGGFHRYSTDRYWLVPHFEKMLYDNALITLAMVEAYQRTGDQRYRVIVEETLDYVLREMRSPEGGFYSTQDADSEGVEGKFFVWSRDEILTILGPQAGEQFCAHYGVSAAGNWEGHNILHRPRSSTSSARPMSEESPRPAGRGLGGESAPDAPNSADSTSTLAASKQKLLAHRSKRIAPGTDTKILASWNGLMIDAMATAGQVFDVQRFKDAAVAAATFVLEKMQVGGALMHSYKDGRARFNGYLEDYACLANSFISVYEATFDPKWIDEADSFVARMIDRYWDDADGGFFFTSKDHESLIARSKDPYDNATPSGNSMAAMALVRLSKFKGPGEYMDRAEKVFSLFRSIMTRSATAASQMLLALGMHLGPTYEFVIASNQGDPNGAEFLRRLQRYYIPNKVCGFLSGSPDPAPGRTIPLFQGKTGSPGKTVIYICQDFACQAPIDNLAEFEESLKSIAAAKPSI